MCPDITTPSLEQPRQAAAGAVRETPCALVVLVAQQGAPLFEAALGDFAPFALLAMRLHAHTRTFPELQRYHRQDAAAVR